MSEQIRIEPERLRFGYRSMGVALRQAPSDPSKPPLMAGNFAVFDEWTEIWDMFEGEFVERIQRGAFEKTFAEDRDQMRVLFQHGRDGQLGSKALGTIESLEETKDGAAYEAQLFRGLPELLLEGLAHNQYGASFRFEAVTDSWEYKPKPSDYNPRALPERTLLELRVSEFGPVTFPAYKTASAALRALTAAFVKDAGRPRTGSVNGAPHRGRTPVAPQRTVILGAGQVSLSRAQQVLADARPRARRQRRWGVAGFPR
jgi:phage head maturation protease